MSIDGAALGGVLAQLAAASAELGGDDDSRGAGL
jgi:hypothetical protein